MLFGSRQKGARTFVNSIVIVLTSECEKKEHRFIKLV
jgi:hypothetical protein